MPCRMLHWQSETARTVVTMARPKKPDALRPVSSYVTQDVEDKLEILRGRYGRNCSAIIRLLIEDALSREVFTPTELAAQAAARALKAERDGTNIVTLRDAQSIDELRRRWRDDDTPSAALDEKKSA